jgi:nucleotide-binding universal stress UspA family protein
LLNQKNAMKPNEPTPIVCGTDFSENARRAANVAAALAARLNAPLLLVHACGLPLEGATQETYDAQTTFARKRLEEEAQRLRALGAMVEETGADGAPDEVLTQVAQQHAARLLVVSSHGRRAPTRWLLGSIAERTAESAPVPTLVVRDAAPIEAWARGERALKVFVGTDFTASSDAALRWVAELRQFGPCEVVACYADWPSENATMLGRNLPPGQRVLERDLREKVTHMLGEDHVQVRVVGNAGSADMPLVDLAVEAQADLVVVGTHQWRGLSRLWHDSVSRGILRHAPMSVACVPTPAAAPMVGPRIRECRRVLVAVDLNEPHGFAAPHGYSIVQPGGTVRLLHNVVPFRLPSLLIDSNDLECSIRKEQAGLVADSKAKLYALAPHEAEARGITTEVEVTERGDTAEAICAAAERFGADVICVGSHTRPGFTAKVLGSVSLAVLQGSLRPVLVVWPPAK